MGRRIMMRRSTMVMAALLLVSGSALAAEGTCKANAMDKKLAGAAKSSFMKKCEADAKTACDAQAAEKKLAGAAKSSFSKKCIKDAVGS